MASRRRLQSRLTFQDPDCAGPNHLRVSRTPSPASSLRFPNHCIERASTNGNFRRVDAEHLARDNRRLQRLLKDTDSGGFQAFSLGAGSGKKGALVKLDEPPPARSRSLPTALLREVRRIGQAEPTASAAALTPFHDLGLLGVEERSPVKRGFGVERERSEWGLAEGRRRVEAPRPASSRASSDERPQ